MRPVVHLVEADPRLRSALQAVLTGQGHRVQSFDSAARFLTDARLDSGCVLLDLRMPDMAGDAVMEELARRGAAVPVIAMASPGDSAAAIRAMKGGAVDCLDKPVAEEEVLAAVERTLEAWHEEQQRRRIRAEAEARLRRLSPRELQILQGLLGGLSNKSIARTLGLSPRTVEMHRANMMDDLALTSLPEALRLAIDAGLAPLAELGGDEPGPTRPEPRPALPRRAGEAERRHEEKLKLVLEASGDGAWEWIIPTSEVRLSTRLVERFGYRREDAPDRFESLEAFIHPEDWELFRSAITDHIEGRSDTFACEFRIRRADGRWAWVFDFGSIVDRDRETGLPLRMAGSVSEITARKEQERRAREASELLDLALWAAGAGIWELDLETRIVRLCRRSRELFGLAVHGPEYFSWHDWEATLHPNDRDVAAGAIDRVLATGAPVGAEFRALHPDGSSRLVRALAKLITDASGRPRRIVGLHQEVAGNEEPGLSFRRAGAR